MKFSKASIPLITLASILTGATSAQSQTLDFHLSPESSSRIIESTTLSDPRIEAATPVLDEARAALGWHYVNIDTRLEGYIPDAKIGKDLLPVDNAMIHLEPSDESPVVGVYGFGTPLEVIDTGIWWKVRVDTNIPVYFIKESPAALAPVTGIAEPMMTQDEPLTLQELDQPVTSDSAIVTIPVADSLMGKSTKPKPGVVGQTYEGIFKRAKPRFGLLKPKATYLLESPDGERIIWVDVSGTVITGSIATYLNQPVIIHGERELLPKSREWIVYARNLRLK